MKKQSHIGAFEQFCAGLRWVMILMFAVGSQAAAETALTIQFDWKHGSSFAAYYYAVEDGLFSDEGLEVTLAEAVPGQRSIKPVVSGKAQFGVSSAESLIVARDKGMALRAIAVGFQRNPVVFVTKPEDGIVRPDDFANKTISVSPNLVPPLQAMMRRIGVNQDQYETVIRRPNVKRFIKDKIDVWGAFVTGLPVRLRLAGVNFHLIFPEDYGALGYAKVLFTTEELIRKDPDLVLRMVRATVWGLSAVVGKTEKAVRYTRKYSGATARKERSQIIASIPLIRHSEYPIGWMEHSVWAGITEMLRSSGQLEHQIDISAIYDTQFLIQIHKRYSSQKASRG